MRRILFLVSIIFLTSCAAPTLTPTLVPTATPLPTATFTPAPKATSSSTPSPSATFTSTPIPDAVLIGAGDIADCYDVRDEQTAALIEKIPGTVFTAGDNVYDAGSPDQFANCYHVSWGKFKDRTRPAPGNHDYGMWGAYGYFDYFGKAAGERRLGYYSYELGAWHIIVLNSNCVEFNACSEFSDQYKWLRQDLAAHPAKCTLAYWHHPLFSMGTHGNNPYMQTLWQALYTAGADVVVSGHDHNYQRFAPQNVSGKLDKEKGIRQFVVGTGGKFLYPIAQPIPNVEVFNSETFGVIKFTLKPASYEWQFIPIEGQTFKDEGKDNCH